MLIISTPMKTGMETPSPSPVNTTLCSTAAKRGGIIAARVQLVSHDYVWSKPWDVFGYTHAREIHEHYSVLARTVFRTEIAKFLWNSGFNMVPEDCCRYIRP